MNGCETLGNLWDHWNECGKNVPETHGVYKIILPAEMELRLLKELRDIQLRILTMWRH